MKENKWRECFRIVVASYLVVDSLYMGLDDDDPKKMKYKGFPGMWDQVSEYFTAE